MFMNRAVESAIRVGVLLLLAIWSFRIVEPFVVPTLWGAIIATAIYPLYVTLTAKLGGRPKLAATVFTLLALALLVAPAWKFFGSTIDGVRSASAALDEGTVQVPPPPEGIGDWPLVGERLEAAWAQASQDLEDTMTRYAPQLRALGAWLLSSAAGLAMTVVQFVISILIAGVLLANASSGAAAVRAVATRLAGARGGEFTLLAEKTTRSVAQGVLGVAVIQALLGAAGMIVVGVPGATIWALLILILAVIQLPPLVILGPVMIYVFSTAGTVTAVLFMIWGIFVSVSDTFLKPMLLGRGVDVPMLVILMGAIGGMMLSGVIGLFVGAVVLALTYQLFQAWLQAPPPREST
jgi:predicted PurR-regulated permease PerM